MTEPVTSLDVMEMIAEALRQFSEVAGTSLGEMRPVLVLEDNDGNSGEVVITVERDGVRSEWIISSTSIKEIADEA